MNKHLFDRPAWMEHAACRGVGPSLWYPEVGEAFPEAKQICASCPVSSECLDYALELNEGWGIWGGLSDRPRRRERRRRGMVKDRQEMEGTG